MPPGHGCSPQSPSPGHLPRPTGLACCPRWPGRAGSRSASCCPCPSPPALPGQPEPASPGRREGPPRALPGLDPLSPAPPEWEQPGCRAPHMTVTLRACSSPSRAQSRGRPPSPWRALPHTSAYKPSFSTGGEGVSAQSRARGARGGTRWVWGPEDRDRGTTLPAGEREAGRGVHRREHARRPRDRWPADPRGQPSGPAPADSGVGRCSLPPGRHTPLLCCTGCWHLKRQTPCCSKIALVTSCEGPVSPFSPNGKETHALGHTMLLRLTDTPSVIGPLLSEASLPG